MAMTAASVTIDLTTCPICQDLFDNPKSLPCLHAFCLKCLQGNFEDNHPRDKVPCPMCRKEFQIPLTGLDGLQHHFFIQQLVDARKASDRPKECDKVVFEVCFGGSGINLSKISTATIYCVNCGQKLCQRCSQPHRKMKGGAHQVIPFGAEAEQELIKLRASFCDKHEEERVKLYCHDCNENICMMCSAVDHETHNKVEIPKAADNFRSSINDNGAIIRSVVNAVRQQSDAAQQAAAEIHTKLENMRKLILATGDKIKHTVDDQISDVVKEVESVSSESDLQAASVEDLYHLALVRMESFLTYLQELFDKGRPSDITRAACQLHDRATELLNNDVTAVKYHPPHVTFTPVDVTQIKGLNLIGKVTRSQPGNRSLL